jgi:LCP family protein required for cell wall assembly
MSQAQAQPPLRRRPRGRGKRRETPTLAAVPELLDRRRPTPSAPRRQQRLPWLPFSLGALAGYALAVSPLPQLALQAQQQLMPLATGLLHAKQHLGMALPLFRLGEQPVLVLGSDVVSGSTDVMMMVQVRNGRTEVLQVPRDTFVESEKLGVVKANALYGMAGATSVKHEMSQLLKMPVDRYLKVNLNAVNRVADALGGVEIDVPERMYYVDNAQGLYIDLYPGRQLLKGQELEGYLRFRHDALGDLGRMERQRQVLAQVFAKLVQPGTLAQLPALLKIAGEDVHTDLSPLEMTQLLSAMATTRLSTSRLPGRTFWKDDLSYWMPDSNLAYQHVADNPPAP